MDAEPAAHDPPSQHRRADVAGDHVDDEVGERALGADREDQQRGQRAEERPDDRHDLGHARERRECQRLAERRAADPRQEDGQQVREESDEEARDDVAAEIRSGCAVHDREDRPQIGPEAWRDPAVDGDARPILVAHDHEHPGRQDDQAEQRAEGIQQRGDPELDDGVEAARSAGQDVADRRHERRHDRDDHGRGSLRQRAQLILETGDRGVDVARRGQVDGKPDERVGQRGNDDDERGDQDADRGDDRDQRGQAARQHPVQPVDHRQQLVGDQPADDEREERRPRRGGQPERPADRCECHHGSADRLRRDRAQAVTKGGPLGRGVLLPGRGLGVGHGARVSILSRGDRGDGADPCSNRCVRTRRTAKSRTT